MIDRRAVLEHALLKAQEQQRDAGQLIALYLEALQTIDDPKFHPHLRCPAWDVVT